MAPGGYHWSSSTFSEESIDLIQYYHAVRMKVFQGIWTLALVLWPTGQFGQVTDGLSFSHRGASGTMDSSCDTFLVPENTVRINIFNH